MTKRILIFILLTSSLVFSQKTESIIHFKDGTKKSGYIKLPPKIFTSNFSIDQNVKFRVSNESKEITKIEFTKISKIDFIRDGHVIKTSFFKIPEKNPDIILLVTLEYQGGVSLFQHIADGTTGNGYGNYSIYEYYVQRDDKHIVKIYPVGILGNGSDKAMMKYFGDCPKLIEYIKNRTFKKYVENHSSYKNKSKLHSRMIEIVKYYNTKCSIRN